MVRLFMALVASINPFMFFHASGNRSLFTSMLCRLLVGEIGFQKRSTFSSFMLVIFSRHIFCCECWWLHFKHFTQRSLIGMCRLYNYSLITVCVTQVNYQGKWITGLPLDDICPCEQDRIDLLTQTSFCWDITKSLIVTCLAARTAPKDPAPQ